jgi:glycerophosphoryl diester phosphodiesterase
MNVFLKIAHRGYSARYPENTLPAFEKAIEAGADMIEFDVHLSRDGELVVIHDDRIDRTSDGTGRVVDQTLAELRRFSYNNGMPEQGFVGIPTLEEVIDLAGNRAMLNIEIKNCPIRHPGIEKRIVDLLDRKGFRDRVVVSSFDHRALAEMKRIAGDVKTGMLYNAVWIKFADEVRALGVHSIHPSLDAAEGGQLAWAKSHGLMVYCWVARERSAIERCRASGLIDGVMVNELELFLAP